MKRAFRWQRGLAACLVLGGALGASACTLTRAVKTLTASPEPVKKTQHPAQKDARIAVLWVGHATALIQLDDKFILTDPVFTSTVGQVEKRRVEPGLDPNNLPPLDAVLVSHVAFDHLSLGSLSEIERKVRNLVIAEEGTNYLTDFGFPVTELRTWQVAEVGGLRITAVPTTRAGGRYGIDDAWVTRGASAYVVEYHGLSVYFSGDAAYDAKAFIETGERFPELDLALLPIGPITPRERMRAYHMDPHDAVQALFDLRARWMLPIHYGTFDQGDDEPGDVLRELGRVVKTTRLGDREVVPLAIGQSHVFMKKDEAHEALVDREPDARGPAQAPASTPNATDAGTTHEDAGPTEAPADEPSDDSDIPDDQRLD